MSEPFRLDKQLRDFENRLAGIPLGRAPAARDDMLYRCGLAAGRRSQKKSQRMQLALLAGLCPMLLVAGMAAGRYWESSSPDPIHRKMSESRSIDSNDRGNDSFTEWAMVMSTPMDDSVDRLGRLRVGMSAIQASEMINRSGISPASSDQPDPQRIMRAGGDWYAN